VGKLQPPFLRPLRGSTRLFYFVIRGLRRGLYSAARLAGSALRTNRPLGGLRARYLRWEISRRCAQNSVAASGLSEDRVVNRDVVFELLDLHHEAERLEHETHVERDFHAIDVLVVLEMYLHENGAAV
jgi:hypothetical protein